MKKRLLWLVAIPLIAIGSLTYATDNEFIVPDTAGWTITVYSQDKSYWITIQDKNLWATYVWDYGYYFQWWNNHGNYAWTNTWNLNELLDANVNERVNKWYSGENNKFIILNNRIESADDYRSGVYYTDETNNSYVWDSAYNNLWWWWNDNEDSNTTIVKWYDTVNHVATNMTWRQWPCPEWYHVPSAWEWQELMMLWCNAMTAMVLSTAREISPTIGRLVLVGDLFRRARGACTSVPMSWFLVMAAIVPTGSLSAVSRIPM